MSRHETITSPKNPRVVEAQALLGKRKARDAAGLFAVEGAREAQRAFDAGFALERLFVEEARLSPEAEALLKAAGRVETLSVTRAIFAKLVMREDSDGILAVFKQRRTALAALRLGPKPLILAVQGVEKPGNLGALLRTADGVGVDAVVLLDGTVDFFHPHVIRGSVGSVFTLPVTTATSDEFRAFCAAHKIRTIAAALRDDAKPHTSEDLRAGVAVLLGSEADGLPEAWIRGADACVKIPMRGVADSLNVSVAGAVILYEALRQRS